MGEMKSMRMAQRAVTGLIVLVLGVGVTGIAVADSSNGDPNSTLTSNDSGFGYGYGNATMIRVSGFASLVSSISVTVSPQCGGAGTTFTITSSTKFTPPQHSHGTQLADNKYVVVWALASAPTVAVKIQVNNGRHKGCGSVNGKGHHKGHGGSSTAGNGNTANKGKGHGKKSGTTNGKHNG